MPRQEIYADNVQEAVDKIIPYLESTAHKAIYFDGWLGLGASAVLRAIAERPPPSLTKKFDKIIHIDCSRWKSRRELQRTIADELKLSRHVEAYFDRQDEEDDFSGIEQDSRAEIGDVTREIYQNLRDLTHMVIFHNGSDNMVDMADFGIYQFDWFPCAVLWTFRGRFRLNREIQEKVDSSHLFVHAYSHSTGFHELIEEDAREITLYAHKHGLVGITTEVAIDCCMYLLSLNYRGGNIVDYSWATHASNYWVCDGIIAGGDKQDSQAASAWDVARALHQEIQLEDYSSSNRLTAFVHELYHYYRSSSRWVLVDTSSNMEVKAAPYWDTTSLFLATRRESGQPLPSLPNDMFQQAVQLRVLKLCGCTFSFSSPPFHRCYNLRFLGLDRCMDQGNPAEEEKNGAPAMEIFKRLWVLDVCQTDWELDFPEEIQEHVATNIREIHIRKGRIWRSSLAWRQLHNLYKIRLIEPTCSQTLVLDWSLPVGPEGIPASVGSFSLDGGAVKDDNNAAKISRITLAGCAKLVEFTLLGSLPNLEELDLSSTAVQNVNLKKEVQVEKLERIFLMGCEQLRAIIWPENGMKQLRLLRIDTRQGVVLSRETSNHSIVHQEQQGYCHAHVSITDIRFLQSLVLTGSQEFCWSTTPFKLNLYLSCSTIKKDGKDRNSEKVGHHFQRTGLIAGFRSSAVHKSLISNTCSAYNDVSIEQASVTEDDDSSALKFEPQDLHIEMGQEMVNTSMANNNSQGIRALYFVMDKVQSLHLHDNCCISSIVPERLTSTAKGEINYHALKWCRVEKCPKLDTVFHTNYDGRSIWFDELKTFWAADLLMARCIWSRGRAYHSVDMYSFAKLHAIHLYRCPRLKFVLPLSWKNTLSSLETLHIVCCGDLKQIFPVEAEFLNKIATEHRNSMLKFPRLKHLYLHQLSNLRQICEAQIFAPKLETVRLRGCWGLKRLPAVDRDGLPAIVDCEKDWWNDLEWDGLDVGHHPSLFTPCHSRYYKKQMLRSTVLR